MRRVKRFQIAPIQAQQGFTLVELVTVVIVLGILALVIIPRFTSNSGFVEYALQKRFMASLRNIQLKAMYDTRSDFCYKINLVLGNTSSASFGPSTTNYVSGNHIASCGTAVDISSPLYLRTQAGEINANDITFTAQDSGAAITYVQFDNIGRAYTSAGTCATGCTFTFTGQSSAQVCIADQGYVYACE
ncbi:MAG: MSHA pilin protein MshC [Kangiellaceae bacterium]|jgi:MSHA pilin protein MshC